MELVSQPRVGGTTPNYCDAKTCPQLNCLFYSGTNGYVIRNLSVLRSHETAEERAAAWDVAPVKHREPDAEILEHERKRKVEVKCLELRLQLEDKE